MAQRQFDRRQFLGAGVVVTTGAALGLRAVLAHEGESHGSTPTAATPGATPAADEVTVEAGSFFFNPEQFTIQADTPTVIRVTNVSDIAHTFTIDELEIDVVVEAGESKTTTVNADPGEYGFHCRFHPNRMTGTMVVEEAAEATTADVTVEAGAFFFDPEQFTIPANTPTVIRVTNVSQVEHSFTVDELGINVEVHPDESKTVTVNVDPGEYGFHCTYHPDRMTGTMIVE